MAEQLLDQARDIAEGQIVCLPVPIPILLLQLLLLQKETRLTRCCKGL